MKKIYSGCFAVSLKGHDAGVVYAVLSEDEKYVFLANGKERKAETPKKKKKKHIKCFFENKLCEYISFGTPITDGRLRRAVRQFREDMSPTEMKKADGHCREEE